MRRYVLTLALLALTGCAVSSGERASGFLNASIEADYLPLSASSFLVGTGRGAAVVIARDIAVTNAHNANLLDPKTIIGRSAAYDLLFFHVAHAVPELVNAQPKLGERVLAYGEGTGGELRVAQGTVTALDAAVEPICSTCPQQSAFTFLGDAGEGFSGGPVVDAEDGHLLGIVFGYAGEKSRTIYAYSMTRVTSELAAIERKLPVDVD